ncbi:MAG: bifunctional UDP-N-acetylmuramoyl-tripeptide:D-alanyl-D-alanine ligase/alanine racemase [Bacteroidia bacterium]
MYNTAQIAKLCNGELFGNSNLICNTFQFDSRIIISTEGVVFVALSSNKNDGHNYIPSLIERGVKVFIVSDKSVINKHFEDDSLAFILVDNTLLALQNLAINHRNTFNGEVIGITGSNGKTIVKEWLYELLSDTENICRSPRSYNSQLGVALSVLKLEKNHSLGIFEAGISKKGEMIVLQEMINPSIGIFTGLGSAHNEGFTSMKEKLKEKLFLFKNANIVIANLYGNEGLKEYFPKQTVSIGQTKDCDYILSYKVASSKASVNLKCGSENYEYEIVSNDLGSILNSATCYVTCIVLNRKNNLTERIFNLDPVEARLEQKNGIFNSIIINDYYSSDVDSLQIALSYLKQQKAKDRYVLIFSDIEQTGKQSDKLYEEIGNLIRSYNLDLVIGIGENIFKHKNLLGANTIVYNNTSDFIANYISIKDQIKNSMILLKGAFKSDFNSISNLLQHKKHETVLEVNLSNLIKNVNYFRSKLSKGTGIMCMVKATGYGSGSSEISAVLQANGVNYLAVAYADEGVELRESSINLPIMVMNPEKDSMGDIIKYRLEPEIYSIQKLKEFLNALDEVGEVDSCPIHIKFDTGMKRLGFEESDLDELVEMLVANKNVYVKSVFSHLVASEDKSSDEFTNMQIKKFETLSDKLKVRTGNSAIRHICNSNAISRFPQAHFEMVRLGIGMYGISSDENDKKHLQSVLSLKTTVSQIKTLKLGESAGYNRSGIASGDKTIATIPIGYADGFGRILGKGNYAVKINGERCATFANICMDMCMVDITGKNVKVGDEVIIFKNVAEIEEMAKASNTISYEILTNISQRVKRVYIQD